MSNSYFQKRSVACPALIAVVALIWLLATATSALAISAPIHIAGTGGEGVYIRPEPNTSRAPVGWMPEGASPDYNCFAWGQNIGGVPIWFNVNYGGVTGYYASYYDDSSYHSNEELTAKYGVPLCDAGAPAPPPSSPPSSPGGGNGSAPGPSAPSTEPAGTPRTRSVFYSGTNTPTGLDGLPAADLNLGYNQWRSSSSGICSSPAAANVPTGVEILSGWSKGRLGPMYFLDGASSRWGEIHWILLFDPGQISEMQGGCDEIMDINSLLADWLKSNSSNHLVVLAGLATEEKTLRYWGHPDFGGLWKYYLAGIWNQSFAGQALICDYNNMSHEDVLSKFSWIIKNPLGACPTADGAPAPVAWHP